MQRPCSLFKFELARRSPSPQHDLSVICHSNCITEERSGGVGPRSCPTTPTSFFGQRALHQQTGCHAIFDHFFLIGNTNLLLLYMKKILLLRSANQTSGTSLIVRRYIRPPVISAKLNASHLCRASCSLLWTYYVHIAKFSITLSSTISH